MHPHSSAHAVWIAATSPRPSSAIAWVLRTCLRTLPVTVRGRACTMAMCWGIYGTGSGRGILVITGHHVVAAGGELPGFARWRVGPGCRVHQLHLDSGDWPADGPAAYFDRVVGRGECDDRRHLGLAVADADLARSQH